MPADDYFSLRGVTPETYADFAPPAYLMQVLPSKDSRILDFGCGFGQLLQKLRTLGYQNLVGADINEEALAHVRAMGIEGIDSTDFVGLSSSHSNEFDFIVMSHVLEHLPKDEMVGMLSSIRGMLRSGGRLMIMVPNAQSSTGCYWAYEDFSHTWLFTSGSLIYVLRAAGFMTITFVDVDCTVGLRPYRKALRKFLLWAYKRKQRMWNSATGSAFHAPSPQIYSYEIKALATQ